MQSASTSPGPLSCAVHDGVRTVLRHDLPASLVVFLFAVPLSLGIAVVSGAPVMAGLIAAVVGGIVAGLLGGTSGSHHGLRRVLCEVLLLNRSPRLADLSADTLVALRRQPALSRWNQDSIHAIHRAVAALGYTQPPAPGPATHQPGTGADHRRSHVLEPVGATLDTDLDVKPESPNRLPHHPGQGRPLARRAVPRYHQP